MSLSVDDEMGFCLFVRDHEVGSTGKAVGTSKVGRNGHSMWAYHLPVSSATRF